MYEAFRSHCLQEYAAPYEVIFGVNDAQDEAIPLVERLQKEFPQQAISLVVCGVVLGANRKVSNLVQMAKRAKFDHLLVNDSDITVPRDYLSRVMRWFAEPKVGMVTCLYRVKASAGVWSKLEALGVLLDFMPGALTARLLERGVHFGLGSTMAVGRAALGSFGGFAKLTEYLADDYELANHIVRAGYEVVVPDVVVETRMHDYSVREFWQHQIRWGRTVRSSRLGGYLGLAVTFGLLWSLVWAGASRGAPMAIGAIVVVLLWRWMLLGVYATALGASAKDWWLMPVRDLITPLVWMGSIGGSKIVWRGETFRLRDGKLSR